MIPPLFEILNASVPVKLILGNKPLRVFPWGQAPQNVTIPYATYGVFNGNPENSLGEVPSIDRLGTQVDVWAKDTDSLLACSVAIRNAIEPHAHMISVDNFDRSPETGLYRCRMDFDFFTARA